MFDKNSVIYVKSLNNERLKVISIKQKIFMQFSIQNEKFKLVKFLIRFYFLINDNYCKIQIIRLNLVQNTNHVNVYLRYWPLQFFSRE